MAHDEADPVAHNEANLTRGMEHMRPYVTVAASTGVASPPPSIEPSVYGIPSHAINPPRNPPSHREQNTQKRTDPFSFGSRYLEEGDDVFEFNAWDHVEIDEAFKDFAEEQYQRQREAPVSEFDRNRINTHPAKPWNRFYSNNSANFFKNRKWLFQEFPTLATAVAAPLARSTPTSSTPSSTNDAGNSALPEPHTMMEIGAGAGNTAFPLLAANQNPGLKIHALDFSSSAVDVMRRDPGYDEKFIQADVWDLASAGSPPSSPLTPCLPPHIAPDSIHTALLIFTLSALSPTQWPQALLNIHTALAPGGEVLFRDYGAGDLAQVRFKKGRWMGERFYVRGDGTRVYFFGEEELRALWEGGGCLPDEEGGKVVEDGAGERDEKEEKEKEVSNAEAPRVRFEVLDLGTDRRMLVNRKRKLRMYRCWMQGRFRKPFEDGREALRSSSPTVTAAQHNPVGDAEAGARGRLAS